ncbi:hypothetical protein YC2023_050335 [Brassica napus]
MSLSLHLPNQQNPNFRRSDSWCNGFSTTPIHQSLITITLRWQLNASIPPDSPYIFYSCLLELLLQLHCYPLLRRRELGIKLLNVAFEKISVFLHVINDVKFINNEFIDVYLLTVLHPVQLQAFL